MSNSIEEVIEAFVSSMYGRCQKHMVNYARYALLRAKYAKKDENHSLTKIKKKAILPPSTPAPHQKILRINLVAYMFKNADRSSVPLQTSLTEFGWIFKIMA